MADMYDLLYGNSKNPKTPNIGLYSLDLETTGTRVNQDTIWSLGLDVAKDNKRSFEHFIQGDSLIPKNSVDPQADFIKANTRGVSKVFGEEQFSRGSLTPYIDAYKNGGLTNLSNSLNQVSSEMTREPGILLIQNNNFETKFLKQAVSDKNHSFNSQEAQDFSSKVFGISDKTRPIFEDSATALEATEFRKQFKDYFTGDIIAGKDAANNARTKNLNEASIAYEKSLTSQISKQTSKGYSTLVDLMDITKMYTLDLHLAGGVDSNYLRLGQNVSFLANTILGEPELHTALGDSKQQSKIFQELVKRRRDIKQNGLQQVDLDFIKNLTSTENTVDVFKKGISSELEGISDKTLEKLSDSKKESFIRSKMDAVLKNHMRTNTGSFDKVSFAEDIVEKFKNGESLEDLVRHTKGNKEGSYSNIGDTSNSIINQSKKSSSDAAEGLKDKFKNLDTKNKFLLAGGLMLGIGTLSSGPQKNKEDIKRQTKQNTYNELYDNVYAGQAYADWTVRNQAHRMTYN